MVFARTLVTSLFILIVLLVTDANAAEQACNNLGANCVCASKWDTPAWVFSGPPAWYHVMNPDPKECREAVVGGFPSVYSEHAVPTVQLETGLPAGNTVTNMTILGNLTSLNNRGGLKVMHSIGGLTGRIGIRYYVWYSTNPPYNSTNSNNGNGTTCDNDKQMAIGDYLTAFNNGYTTSNGGHFPSNVGPEQLRGKWVRLEYYNRSDNTYEAYVKNITDNTPEETFTHPPRLGRGASGGFAFVSDDYRGEIGCRGYRVQIYALMAHWPTNSGQRIPPAVEVEGGGGGGDTTPPASPTGLSVQ